MTEKRVSGVRCQVSGVRGQLNSEGGMRKSEKGQKTENGIWKWECGSRKKGSQLN